MLKLTLIFSLLFLYSCGESPLFNHENENPENLQGTTELNSALSFKNSNLSVKVNWLKGPYADPSLENSYLIIIHNKGDELVDVPNGYEFYNWGWMPSMGHGTADDGYTERISKGIYIQKELYFNMGGDWDLNIELYNGETRVDSTKIELKL